MDRHILRDRFFAARHIFRVSLVLLMAAQYMSACGNGGGTSGTGGGGFGISGTLRTVSSVPVSGVQVSVTQQDGTVVRISSIEARELSSPVANDITDSQGQFDLSLDSRPVSVSLLFEGDTFQSVVEVASVPESATKVVLELVFNEDSEAVEQQTERFEDEDGDDVSR